MWEYWRNRFPLRWEYGGGPLAAILWWATFLLITIDFICLMNLLRDKNDKPAQMQSLSNLKQINRALLMYSEDYDDRLPDMSNLSVVRQALDPYLAGSSHKSDESLWQTPKLPLPYGVNSTLSYKKMVEFRSPSQTVTFWDKHLWTSQLCNVAFLDDHTRANVPPQEWDQLCKQSGIPVNAPEPEITPEPGERFLISLLPLCIFLAGALPCITAVVASWREAEVWSQDRQPYALMFVWWFLVRLFGYGSLVFYLAFFVGGLLAFALSFAVP